MEHSISNKEAERRYLHTNVEVFCPYGLTVFRAKGAVVLVIPAAKKLPEEEVRKYPHLDNGDYNPLRKIARVPRIMILTEKGNYVIVPLKPATKVYIQ